MFKRCWLALGIPVVLLLGSATVAMASTSNPVSGTAAGKSVSAPTPAATCNPQAPQQTSDYLCRFKLHGSYFDDTYLGDGTYSGTVTIDYRTYAYNATYNENCANVSGSISYHRKTAPTGTLRTVLDSANSYVCEQSDPTIHDTHLTELVSGGSGTFANVIGGTITSSGTSYPTSTPGTYNDESHFTGSVTTP